MFLYIKLGAILKRFNFLEEPIECTNCSLKSFPEAPVAMTRHAYLRIANNSPIVTSSEIGRLNNVTFDAQRLIGLEEIARTPWTWLVNVHYVDITT